MTVWLDRPEKKEEGRRKSAGHGMVARPSGGGGGRDSVFNHGLDPQVRIMERLGDMTAAARSENLHIPLTADGREICLHFLSKGDCIKYCTISHAPVRGNNREAVIQYIRVGRVVMDPSSKRNFHGGGDQGSHRRHWDRSGGNGTRNSEGKNHENGAVFGSGKCGHSGGKDGNNGRCGAARGGSGNNTNPPPPPTKTGIKCGAVVRTVGKEVGWHRGNY